MDDVSDADITKNAGNADGVENKDNSYDAYCEYKSDRTD